MASGAISSFPHPPEGLRSLLYLIVLRRSDFQHDALISELDARGLLHRQRATNGELTIPLQGRGQTTGINGLLTFTPRDAYWDVRYSAALNSDFPAEPMTDVLEVSQFAPLVARFWNAPDNPVGTLRGSFTLPAPAWELTIALPLRMPGVLDESLGTPVLVGAEFEFEHDQPPVRRVNILISADRARLFIRPSLRFALHSADNFHERAFAALTDANEYFVQRLPDDEVKNAANA
jgi:hypothetical protein